MALKAGYVGIKAQLMQSLRDKLLKLDGIIPAGASSDNPLATESEINSLWEVNAKTGVHNLLNNTLSTTEYAGVTYTVNADKSISLSGTANPNSSKDIATYTGAELKAMGSSLILSGGIDNDAYFILRKADWSGIAQSKGNEVTFSTANLEDAVTYYATIAVMSGKNVDGKAFYPMLRLSTDTNPAFAPYAMTNEELTKNALLSESACTSPAETVSTNKIYKRAGVVELNLQLTGLTAAYNDVLGVIPDGYRPKSDITAMAKSGDTIKGYQINATSGNIILLNSVTNASFQIHETWITTLPDGAAALTRSAEEPAEEPTATTKTTRSKKTTKEE